MSEIRIVLDRPAVDNMLKGRNGLVAKVHAGWAGEATKEVRKVADSRVQRRTGEYVGGITSSMTDKARGPEVLITAAAAYSTIIESGSRPHVIVGNPWLASIERGFGPVHSVFHPGTKPQNVLRDGVRDAVRMYGRIGLFG